MKVRSKVLIVDDSPFNRALLADMLRDEYDILEATNGLEAIAIIEQNSFELSLVLLDIVMPEIDGFEVLALMNKNKWLDTIPVIIISAETTSSYIDQAYDLGATEYINRPFDPKTVQRRVSNVIMLYSKQKLLENMVTEQVLEKEKSNLIMVEVLSHIVEFRNGESGMHVLNIRTITELLLKQLCSIADQYSYLEPKISLIANASSLHDIGKISIDEAILNKPGPLSPQEYNIMKTHSMAGATMLEHTRYYPHEELVRIARDICRWHHERYDGSGYPDGLAGDEIPMEAQVVALADVYDALTYKRVYKDACTHEQALDMIFSGECGAFHPILLKCLAAVAPILDRELKVRSPGYISQAEVQSITSGLLQRGITPNRTLCLLEQERVRHQFYASLAHDIMFEHIYESDMLVLSDWSALHLGLPKVLLHPIESAELHQVMRKEDCLDLQNRVRYLTPRAPVLIHQYQLKIGTQWRWHQFFIRPLWMGNDTGTPTGLIGKCTDIQDSLSPEEQP